MNLPPRKSAYLRLHREEPAHRDEGRQLMHAALDGEIDEQSPRLQELLQLDPVLRAEFAELRALESAFASPLSTPDVSERVLARLQAQKVVKDRGISPFFGGLAASVAIGSLVAWLALDRTGGTASSPTATLATVVTQAIPVGAPSMSSEERLVEDARRAIAETTGRPIGRDSWRLTTAPVIDVGGELDLQVRRAVREQPAPSQAISGGGDVAITRAGLAFVNPGPTRTPVAKLANDPMLGQVAAGSDWQPTATRRRDNVRFVVSGWYDNDGNYVRVGNTRR
jgi:hypothetical protein